MDSKIRQNTIVEQVMERIKGLIASGQYQVGDKLPTESELGQMFGIGRSSVREAIKIFNYLGILESRTARGTYVCSRSQISSEALSWAVLLGSNEMRELLETRAAIELWSVIQLTGHYSRESARYEPYIVQLEQTITDMRDATRQLDFSKTIELDFQFHDVIISSSENSLFISIYHTLRAFMLASSQKIHQDKRMLAVLPDLHDQLLQAILSKSVLNVINEMQNHIQITKEKLYTSIIRSPETWPEPDPDGHR